MNGFNRDTFITADRETRDKMLFDMLSELYASVKALEGNKWIHRGLSACGGVVGGFGGVLAYWYFFKGALT